MSFTAKIATLIVKTIDYSLFFLKPQENKITYISYNSNTLPKGMSNISKHLKDLNPNLKQTTLTFKYTNSFLNKVFYAFELIKQVYHIKTSSAVFIGGNNFVISNIDTPNTYIIQLWHASGAIKKFGMDYTRKYTIKNYDYMITASEESIPNMAKAFNIPEDHVLPLGYADIDILFDKDYITHTYNTIYNKYSNYIKDKKVVLLAPTFRGEAIYQKQSLDLDFYAISEQLGEEYIILYKSHPILDTDDIVLPANVLNVSKENIYDLFLISDILVSDYSSIIYDFSILEKDIVLYAPDLHEYQEVRGLYIDYTNYFKYPVTQTIENLIHTIKNIRNINNDTDRKHLKNTFFKYQDSNSALRIAQFTHSLLNNKY